MKYKHGYSHVNECEHGTWQDWFAWYPVKTQDGKYRWFELTERRAEYTYCGIKWKYRKKELVYEIQK